MNIPAEERELFLLAGHLANELIFLSKLAAITENKSQEKFALKAELTQFLFIYKILVGKLHEGWAIIRKHYFGDAISMKYHGGLDEGAKNLSKS